MNASDLLVWGIALHLIADWLFQNDWQARHKANLRHPAGWVHGGIHLIAMLLVFRPEIALAIAAAHILIDTRKPLIWWRRVYRQTTDPANPFSIHVAIWGDQVAHVAVIALAALLQTSAA